MKISVLIVMFFLIGAFFIISNHKLSISKNENRLAFASLYKTWLGKLVDNTVSSVGYVVKMNWLPEKNVVIKQEKEENDKGKLQEEWNEWGE